MALPGWLKKAANVLLAVLQFAKEKNWIQKKRGADLGGGERPHDSGDILRLR